MSSEQPTATTVQQTHPLEQLSYLRNHTSEMVKRLTEHQANRGETSIDSQIIAETTQARRTMDILLKANADLIVDLTPLNSQALSMLQHDWGNGHSAATDIGPFLEKWYDVYGTLLAQYR